jgi:hypothetical protein
MNAMTTNFSLSSEISQDDGRQELWKQQRETRGFDDTELWNLDTTIAKFIYPRLIAYKAMGQNSYPGKLESVEQWNKVLDKMIFSFHFLSGDEKFQSFEEDEWTNVDEGLALFAEHFGSLWN